eukprot:SAG22_NODE_1783_length_3591_cov_1.767182_3_plen_97_part_00
MLLVTRAAPLETMSSSAPTPAQMLTAGLATVAVLWVVQKRSTDAKLAEQDEKIGELAEHAVGVRLDGLALRRAGEARGLRGAAGRGGRRPGHQEQH